MITAITAAILFIVLVGIAMLGRRVRRYLPQDHLSAESKDAVKLAMGLVATMTALLLGLLISSAKGTYDTVRSEVSQMAAKVAFLDRVLAAYGPEAAGARVQCRDVVADAVARMWPEERGRSAQAAPNEQAGDALYFAVLRLSPNDDAQRALKAQAGDRYGGPGRASVAVASAGASVHFEAAFDRTGLLAGSHLLWFRPDRAT